MSSTGITPPVYSSNGKLFILYSNLKWGFLSTTVKLTLSFVNSSVDFLISPTSGAANVIRSFSISSIFPASSVTLTFTL